MRVVTTSGKLKIAAITVLLASWASPLRAQGLDVSRYYPNQQGGGDTQGEDIDFAVASYPTGTTGNLNGLKYMVVNLATYNSHSQCFDVWTDPAQSTTSMVDTRIWVWDPGINDYRSLNDDVAPGNLYSRAHFWISPPWNGGRYVTFLVSTYSSYYNSATLKVEISKMPSSTTEAQCTSGPTYKSTASGNFFINAN